MLPIRCIHLHLFLTFADVKCGNCFYCRRGRSLLCENYIGIGCSAPGGFAEYISLSVCARSPLHPRRFSDPSLRISKANKLFKIHNLSDEEATLIEPAACAVHGMDQLKASVGVEALIIGAGPTGLILAQMLKMNGAARVIIAANKGIKMDLAKQLDAGTEYIELDRENPQSQWEQLKKDNPYGFDVVVGAYVYPLNRPMRRFISRHRSKPLAQNK